MDSDSTLPSTTDDAVRAVEAGRGVEIMDETPLTMFVRYYDYQRDEVVTRNVTKNDRNELLYKYGLHDLINGEEDTVYVLSQDPYAAVSASGDSTYTLWVGDEHPVQSSPSKEEEVLRAVREMEEAPDDQTWHTQLDAEEGVDGELMPLKEVHQHILDTQVRRDIVNQLLDHVPFEIMVEKGTLEANERGWLFHGGLLLTWEVELRNERDIDGFYEVEGSTARRVSDENDAFDLERLGPGRGDWRDDLDRHTVEFAGREVTFGLKEMEFVTTAIWVMKNVRPRGGNL